jgi:hypothetical protein
MRRRHALTALLAALALAGVPAAAAGGDLVLGADGALYSASVGRYADLFPGGGAAAADNTVLALDVKRPGAPSQRLLVRGSEGHEIENTPSLVYDQGTGSLYLVWISRESFVFPVLRLTSYDGSEWSEPVTVQGNVFAAKTAPQTLVTSDTFQRRVAGAATEVRRIIIHLLWAEESATGGFDTFYAPVLLQENSYPEPAEVFNLTDLAGSCAGPATESLEMSPALVRGGGTHSVVAVFASRRTGCLTAVDIHALPEDLRGLADDARATIIHIGARAQQGTPDTIAAEIRKAILEAGEGMAPELVMAIGRAIEEKLGARGTFPKDPDSVLGIADDARATIIHIGARLSRPGLRAPAGASSVVRVTAAAPLQSLAQLVEFRTAFEATPPSVGNGSVRLFASEDGDALLVSWVRNQRVIYRVSQGDGWSEPLELVLGENLDLPSAYKVLDERVRRR